MKKILILIVIFLSVNVTYSQITKIKIGPDLVGIRSLSFINKDTGIVIANSLDYNQLIYSTFDGGDTWIPASFHTSSNWYLTTVHLMPGGKAYSGGQDGVTIQSADYGRNWVLGPHVGSGTNDFEDIGVFNDSTFVIMRCYGNIYQTHNYGVNWTIPVGGSSLSSFMKTNAFEIINDSVAYAAHDGIYKTTDMGASWARQAVDTSYLIRNVCMIDSVNGFAVGNNGVIYHTTDAWTTNQYETKFITNYDLFDISFINDLCGIAIGGKESGLGSPNSDDTVGVIFITNDGGDSWQESVIGDASLMEMQTFGDIIYITSTDGYFYIIENLGTLDLENIEEPLVNRISLYPNPTTGILNLNWLNHKNGFVYKIFNVQGALIDHQLIQSEKTSINCAKFEKGIYFIQIDDGKTSIIKKFINL